MQVIADHPIGTVLTRQSRRGRRILLVSALLLAVGGCNAIGGAFSSVSSSVKGAVFPGGDEQNSGRSNTTAQAAPAPAASTNAPAPLGSGTSDERIERLEQEVTALRAELAQLKPSIERLVGIEGDIRVLLTQLSRLTGPDGAATATTPSDTAAAETDTGSEGAPAQAPAPNPPALQPVEQTQPAPAPGQPQSLRPLQPVQAAPAQAPPHPRRLRRRSSPRFLRRWHRPNRSAFISPHSGDRIVRGKGGANCRQPQRSLRWARLSDQPGPALRGSRHLLPGEGRPLHRHGKCRRNLPIDEIA